MALGSSIAPVLPRLCGPGILAAQDMALSVNNGVPLVIEKRGHQTSKDIFALAGLISNARGGATVARSWSARASGSPASSMSARMRSVTARSTMGIAERRHDELGIRLSYWGSRHGPQTPNARTRPGAAVARLGDATRCFIESGTWE